MRFRKLRITWTVFCGIACVLLVVLWVRSYVWFDNLVGPVSSTRCLGFESSQGWLTVRWDQYTMNPKAFPRWTLNKMPAEALEKAFKLLAARGTPIHSVPSFGFHDGSFQFPHWSIVVLTGVLAVAFATCRPYRINFSLRTLLIATTLVAAVLGLIVWSAR